MRLATLCIAVIATSFGVAGTVLAQSTLHLNDAVTQAQSNDPWLQGNRLQQKAKESRSVAAGELPDPSMSFSMMNLPVDGFRFDQENMTQAQVGISQAFPRGDSRSINQQKLAIQSAMGPFERDNRRAMVKRDVTLLWLDAWLAMRSKTLIEDNKILFEQIRDVAQTTYASAAGKSRQQDMIRAELELIQFEDRATVQAQNLEAALSALGEWLYPYQSDSLTLSPDSGIADVSLPAALPEIDLLMPIAALTAIGSDSKLIDRLSQHPTIQAIELQYQASQKDVELAREQYKPEWKLNASYGWRDDMPSGQSRADLFSVGITLDLPLFTDNRQDKTVEASVYEAQSVKTQKLVTLKSLRAQVREQTRHLARLKQRESLYRDQILTQANAQAEATLTAYMNDTGDFSEVVRARITELEARLAALAVQVEKLKRIAMLNYYLTQSDATTAAAKGASHE
ncbi:TolC family protein [Salinimonas sp. HHU 13199]|uniref:TolC family protein n=1 Tax=Salinimonas profundi TaxID=2729140 RepID=A0ABR8LKU4_9ALTE|nr:TolC family protein [Salinimonas profundi]MBD3584735.1 TolC family protein [Salinimonas profundi]